MCNMVHAAPHLRQLGQAEPEVAEERAVSLPDLLEIPAEAWAVANRRREAIRSFAGRRRVPRAEVEQRSAETGVAVATLYRWMYGARCMPRLPEVPLGEK
jgi:hypothetical protein